MPKVLIIGAGLSGLSTAYALRNANIQVEILEARSRLGGRILTKNTDAQHLELGATWFGPQHSSLFELIHQLDISYKIQENGEEALYDFRPEGQLQRFQIPSGPSTYKFQNGTSTLINSLHQNSSAKIHFNQKVKTINYDSKFKIYTEENLFEADVVVISVPVQLVADSINFEPNLSEALITLLTNTHTWMSDSIKFSAAFDCEFWKSEKFIGTLMSPKQIIQEMYDHSDLESTQNALVGFINSNVSQLSSKEREEKVQEHLKSIFPEKKINPKAYADINWRKEDFTISKNSKSLIPHQNNGNFNLRKSHFDNKLFFSASETASQTPGYMNGAIHRGLEVGDLILEKLA